MTKNIALLIIICCLFGSCQDDEVLSNEKEMDNNKETVSVKVNLSINELTVNSETEYIPMTRAAGEYMTKIASGYKCIILKLIDSSWYVNGIYDWYIDENDNNLITIQKNGKIAEKEVELLPGTYRMAVFLNSPFLEWNENIQPGMLVKKEGEEGDYPMAFTYWIETYRWQPNYLLPMLGKEIFTGYTDFTVEKTADVHSVSTKSIVDINLSRKVSKFVVYYKEFIKDGVSLIGYTALTFKGTIRVKEDHVLCDGLNVIGLPYYDKENPRKTQGICFTTTNQLREANNGNKYCFSETNATVFSPFFITDSAKTEGVPYTITDITITGQSTGDYNYRYDYSISRVLKNNEVDGIVLAVDSIGGPDKYGKSVLVFTESLDGSGHPEDASTLFYPDYEWTLR